MNAPESLTLEEAGLVFATPEDYADEGSPVWDLGRAVGFLPRPKDYRGPESVFGYLPTLK